MNLLMCICSVALFGLLYSERCKNLDQSIPRPIAWGRPSLCLSKILCTLLKIFFKAGCQHSCCHFIRSGERKTLESYQIWNLRRNRTLLRANDIPCYTDHVIITVNEDWTKVMVFLNLRKEGVAGIRLKILKTIRS